MTDPYERLTPAELADERAWLVAMRRAARGEAGGLFDGSYEEDIGRIDALLARHEGERRWAS